MFRVKNYNKRFIKAAARRFYHDDSVYGYRVAKEFKLPDYTQEELSNRMKHGSLLRMVQAYRTHGHEGAHLDPLDIMKRKEVLALKPERYGLAVDNNETYDLKGILHAKPEKEADFKTVMDHLQSVYCGKIAYEFMHLPSASERRWWYHAVENWEKPQLTKDQKKRIHKILSQSEVFDQFLGKKFPNVKRYGLEGAESMMVAMDRIFELSATHGVQDVVIGMPHRGRLNLLCDLLEYPYPALFHKMKGHSELPPDAVGSGDVISHLFNNPTLSYGDKNVHVSLFPNPSHLEAVNPVVMGKARAKQTDRLATSDSTCNLGDKVMCVQIHGDAAFSGQGIVMESFGMSNLPHYSSGGSIHIVVNNQLGYTTPAQNARSSAYCSDIGKMINVPVIHVNGDFPEEVSHALDLVFEYRHKFRKDIILDLMCYRRWGHNELDEPAFTQPSMYNNIRHRTSVPKLYETKLLQEGILGSDQEAQKVRDAHIHQLEQGLSQAESYTPQPFHLEGNWKSMQHNIQESPDTGYDASALVEVGRASISAPEDIRIHSRLQKYHIDQRSKRLAQGSGLDWATAEALAFGSLLKDGYDLRISGQDVGRGTFSQRHAMFVCQETERAVVPLNHMDPDQKHFLEVANSPLSEFAVLGFEYGMSVETPNRLVLWEAQFGDFFNGAQIPIDTFISSGEDKWLRQSGLVMLLPHGQDGAGPEHSSSRVERFLQMSNDSFDVNKKVTPNWHIVNCTTPAQYFHVLRRQMLRRYRKPLIVISPKSLLKSPLAVSSLDEMTPGTRFKPVLQDDTIQSPDQVEKVVFVSGKYFYDLRKERESRQLNDKVALIRVEELVPFPKTELEHEIKQYKHAQEFIWCQEEPQNAGAYTFMAPRLNQLLPGNKTIEYVGREPLAAPAVGISSVFKKQAAQILQDVMK